MKYKKIILIILIICWMATIFMFSNQGSKKSKSTSTRAIEFIVDKIYDTSNMTEQEIAEKVESLQTPVRKLAHFTIYTLGGVITFVFMYKLNTTNKRKILYSLLFCLMYAITDEIHQYFIPGRSCEIRDVLIDTIGSLIGILITYLIYSKKKNKIDYNYRQTN